MSTVEINQTTSAFKRRRRHVLLTKEKHDDSVLEWNLPKQEDMDMLKVTAWYSKCGEYKVARVVSRYDPESLYFVAMKSRIYEYADGSRSYRMFGFIHQTEMGRPKEYRTLEGALNVCEEDAGKPSSGKGDVLQDAVTQKIDRAIAPTTVVKDGKVVHHGGKAKETIFGFPMTAVIRWMGVDCWNYDQARTALSFLKIKIADTTIHAQLRAGRKGERGPPAELSPGQERELYDLIN